ncbi:hypothetical protein HY346_00125 [Candidatus Microgenomates bacterium]|nr:hypothetical protein [Candidatus Microgenomates bacterium]
MTSSGEVPIVAIHALKSSSDDKISRVFGDIYDRISELGAQPVVTRDTKTFDQAEGTFSRYFLYEGRLPDRRLVVHMGALAIDAALNKTGGLNSQWVPLLSHPELRRFCNDKWRVNQLLSDVQPQTLLLPAHAKNDLEQALHALHGPWAAVKRTVGYGGKATYVGPKAEVYQTVIEALAWRELDSTTDLLVQAYRDTSGPLPGLRGINDADTDRLASAQPKELRLYMIDDQLSLGVARVGAADRGEDIWTFVDQDSIPADAVSLAQTATRLIQAEVGKPDSYIGVDLYWDNLQGRWQIGECNGRNPAYIKHVENAEFARRQRRDIGSKLVEMAQRYQSLGEEK